jgi:hypothetical protein
VVFEVAGDRNQDRPVHLRGIIFDARVAGYEYRVPHQIDVGRRHQGRVSLQEALLVWRQVGDGIHGGIDVLALLLGQRPLRESCLMPEGMLLLEFCGMLRCLESLLEMVVVGRCSIVRRWLI